MDTNAIKSVLVSKSFAVLLASAVSAVSGAVVSYKYLAKKLETKYADIATMEIHQAKLFYRQQRNEGEFSDPIALAQKYQDDKPEEVPVVNPQVAMVKSAVEIMENQNYISYDKPDQLKPQSPSEKLAVAESIEHKNVFNQRGSDETDVEFDPDAELDKKSLGRPYILSKDDFYTNEDGFDEVSLIYWEEDGVVAGVNDVVMTEAENAIGLENIRFGYGSENKDGVFICNEGLATIYEVTRANGSFAETVHGLQHDEGGPKVRKFRNKDWD